MQFENHYIEALEKSDYFELAGYHPRSGDPVAFLAYVIPLDSKDVYVRRLIIHPKFKGRGIGGLMMEELVKRHAHYKIHLANATFVERKGLRKLKYKLRAKWISLLKWLNVIAR